MNIEMKAILLHSLPYRIVDNKTGEVSEGISLWFHGSSDLTPDEVKQGNYIVRGTKPLKFNIPLDQGDKIKEAPGLYNLRVKMKGGQGNAASLQLLELTYIDELVVSLKGSAGKPSRVQSAAAQ